MGGAMEQLMLVVHHVFVSECALMLQSRVKNKIDMVLHRNQDCTGLYDVEPWDILRWIDAIEVPEGPPREGAAEGAQQRRQQAQFGPLVAQAQLQAGLERDVAREMMDSMMEQLQLDSYVMLAPEIVDNNTGIVAHELHEYHNKVQMHHDLAAEATAEPRSNGDILVSRRGLFEGIEHVRIDPGFSYWQPASSEDDLILYTERHNSVLSLKRSVTEATTPWEVGVLLVSRREQFGRFEYDRIQPEIVAWRPRHRLAFGRAGGRVNTASQTVSVQAAVPQRAQRRGQGTF